MIPLRERDTRFDVPPERLAVLRRLAREFVDELLSGRRHRRATHEEAPPTAARREEMR